jgi:hypothetical protein
MAQSLDFESDQFLQLLTDALRAGPASPEWHQAVARLRTEHSADIDEFKLLVAARQHLESGKEYRSVRAGPEFTRKIMTSLEAEEPAIARRKTKVPTANLIAVVSAMLMIGVVVVVVLFLIPGKNEAPIAVDALASTYFSEPALNASFDSPLDPQWRSFGTLKLDVGNGLSPALPLEESAEAVGGGIYWSQPLDATQPISIEAALRVSQSPDNLIAQVFVTDQPEFSETRGTGQHELAWSLQNGQATLVLPSGNVAAQSPKLRDLPTTLAVRIVMDRGNTIVEMGGKQIWKGEHGLGQKPRYVGLRFLRVESQSKAPRDSTRHASDKDALVFQSLRVLKAQKQ